MKTIDIHTHKEVSDEDRYKNSINGSLVRDYVLENVDFPITDEYWIIIDHAFSTIWNKKVGIGGYFYWDEFSLWIYEELQQKKVLIEYERVDRIANLMLSYIKDNNGFME